MSDKLTTLYREGKINKYEFDTYLVFEGEEKGRDYLKKMLEAIVLQEPIHTDANGYAFRDGQRSSWRTIKIIINKIENLMEGIEHVSDGSSDNNYGPQPLHTFYPPN